MTNNLIFSAFILLLGSLTWFGLPWWTLAVIAGFLGFFIKNKPWVNFGLAFGLGGLLWAAFAAWQNFQNMGILSSRIGQLFGGLSAAQLIWATAFIGSLLAGMGALTGSLARELFFPEKRGRYERRRRSRW